MLHSHLRRRSTTPPSDSPRQTRSRITISGLRHPTLSTRRGQTLEGNPGRHAVCGPAVVKSSPLFPPRPPRAAAPLPPHLLDRRCLALVAPHLHTIAMSARRRLAPLTPRPTAGPSRSPAPRVSAFRRTPKLRPRYGHHVPASCATPWPARRTPVLPARAYGPVLFRPPNTCTLRQLGARSRRLLRARAATPARFCTCVCSMPPKPRAHASAA
jgi:hypothetical protein